MMRYVYTAAITRDDKYIISGSGDKTLRIWNFKEKTLEAVLPGHNTAVTSILITSDYRYIASRDDQKQIRIWDLRNRSHEGVFIDKNSAREWILKYREIESLFI